MRWTERRHLDDLFLLWDSVGARTAAQPLVSRHRHSSKQYFQRQKGSRHFIGRFTPVNTFCSFTGDFCIISRASGRNTSIICAERFPQNDFGQEKSLCSYSAVSFILYAFPLWVQCLILPFCYRKMYVFKVVPFLNPDGVVAGCYRSDNFGQNLNRVYLSPKLDTQPSIYAVRKLIR